ncbi:uroporphyrinogen-III C-methyltransferase [Erwinia sp. OLTSP20]|uniref:uroporphyrinogen-III C-methyltransferase n=1 Tax=unclassified Erwinia TaxID=2622719 RepID=UPI000C18EC80|nr:MULTISPECIES: uroporphyrinogen-III C-methyltransferase [unclassified Erwinia]PIJ49984.1 uroporphyrinogen-III C-methyltransferase [Erwinia sp. OAMSP11]PIJ71406.1 uroporphyrinogen-III C-methyltransferase [Erwinia sp. OLSSP12]PIJ80640.1 uroporphyrinogen-III C-methyltransferase [Erwinia sp. OLCASP19]PIJ82802.1 uroporphyrinogen-III C-methyltransferase [Erwinia sp. OLMTSP26]PIJ85488.1 uroporphyrinogen-III C-methyltransferase [Erwinia sp. OLMDSP33]
MVRQGQQPGQISAVSDSLSDSAGEVWLVGAGPGDAELLTVKALRLLQQARMVVYDRLVSEEIMRLVTPNAQCIDVGKCPGAHGVKQQHINRLLVRLAQRGHQVIRLKGGDPFIFGRGGEEMAWLQQAGIRCHVVPGITAASGCAAAAGIPLTHRNLAHSVQLITGHGRHGEPHCARSLLADNGQTLVFYMGLHWCESLARQMLAAGRRPDTPVALIENGTRPTQRVVVSSLQQFATDVRCFQLQSPALIVVGEVVTLYQGNAESASRCG